MTSDPDSDLFAGDRSRLSIGVEDDRQRRRRPSLAAGTQPDEVGVVHRRLLCQAARLTTARPGDWAT